MTPRRQKGRWARRWTTVVPLTCWILTGCSERPAGELVWKQDLLGIKTSLTSVVSFSGSDAIAVGHALPEFGLVARPLCLRWNGSGWIEVPMPASRSTALLGATLDREGSVWAVGRLVSTESEPFDPDPIVYRLAGGTWTIMPLDELGSQVGLALTSVASVGSGPDLEVRACGDVAGQSGRIIRWANGHWSVMAVPDPPVGVTWTLRSIAYSATSRIWYAVGRKDGAIGGTILVDRGAGWEALEGPAVEVEWTSVAFDGRAIPHLAGNHVEGLDRQGLIYRLRLGSWIEAGISRRTGGRFHLWAIGFDAAGNGWAVGGRESGGPFFTGTTPLGWTESAVEAEVEEHPENEEVEAGDLTGVSVLGERVAFSVGSAQEADPEGGSEFQPRVFRLTFRPAGEHDLTTGPPPQ